MAVSVTHATNAAGPDDGTSQVGSDEWNEAHTVTGVAGNPFIANVDGAGYNLTGLGTTYTLGTELISGGDLVIDPFLNFSWSANDAACTYAAGTISCAPNGSSTYGGFYVPVSMTSGTRYLLEIHQTVSGDITVATGFSHNFDVFLVGNEAVMKAEFTATYTGSDTLYIYLANAKSTSTRDITFVSLKAITVAATPSLSAKDLGGNTILSLGTLSSSYGIGRNVSASMAGSNNIALGSGALSQATATSNNIAIGAGALNQVTSASAVSNIAIGTLASSANTTGLGNVAIGPQALMRNQVGNQNVAIGNNALGEARSDKNIAIGFALVSTTTAVNNIALGHNAGAFNTTGGYNIFIGYRTGLANTTGTHNIIIGSDDSANVNVTTSGASHYLNLGNVLKGDMVDGPLAFQKPFSHVGVTFSGKPASPVAGSMMYFTDSSTTTWGATISGGGANKVMAWYNGSNWTVVGV